MTNERMLAFDAFKAQIDALDASALLAVRGSGVMDGQIDYWQRTIEKLKSDIARDAREAHLLP